MALRPALRIQSHSDAAQNRDEGHSLETGHSSHRGRRA